MNKVVIQCNDLIDEYQLNQNIIIQQLQTLNVNEHQNFVVGYILDSRFTLMGKMKNNQIILEHIEKALDYYQVDNSDILSI